MSEHAIPHEPEKDRALISVVAVLLALALALFSWKSGSAAPLPIRSAPAGDRGAVAVEHGTTPQVELGTVLQRGATVHVLNPGSELIIPRSRVLEIDAASTQNLPQKYAPHPSASRSPRARAAAVQKKKKRLQGPGTVISHEGVVYVGRLQVGPKGIRVDMREENKTITISKQYIRWYAMGVEGPNADYWRQHASKSLDPRYARQPQGAAPPKPTTARAVAVNHRLAGRWKQATEAFLGLYLEDGDAASLAEARRASRHWVRRARSGYDADQRLLHLQKQITPKGLENPGLRKLLGDELVRTAHDYMAVGDLNAAQAWGKRLVNLGGELAVQGQQILEQIQARRER